MQGVSQVVLGEDWHGHAVVRLRLAKWTMETYPLSTGLKGYSSLKLQRGLGHQTNTGHLLCIDMPANMRDGTANDIPNLSKLERGRDCLTLGQYSSGLQRKERVEIPQEQPVNLIFVESGIGDTIPATRLRACEPPSPIAKQIRLSGGQ